MNFEPAVMRKLERWSKEENEEEYIYGKTDDFADAYYTMLQRIRNDYPDAEVVCMIPYHTIYSAALPVLLEDTEKGVAIISMYYFKSDGTPMKDRLTYHPDGEHIIYLDANGAMEQQDLFRFANGRDLGYANADGTLMHSGFSYDPYGRIVFFIGME